MPAIDGEDLSQGVISGDAQCGVVLHVKAVGKCRQTGAVDDACGKT